LSTSNASHPNRVYADFHNHTTFSPDSQTSPRALVDALVVHPFVKVAAVTDHDTIKGLDAVRQLAAPYPDILIIPGVEITSRQGDIVVLGAQELPPKQWDVEDVVDFARETGCVTIAVHPFRPVGLGDEVADSGVDAIEIYNGGSTALANKKARELAKQLGLPGVSGSDSHSPAELFSVFTEVQASLDVDEILAAIRQGHVVAFPAGKSIRF
jgi:predicted metal-dependent phosphoesterase TrpH